MSSQIPGQYGRRQFMALGAAGISAIVLAACGSDDKKEGGDAGSGGGDGKKVAVSLITKDSSNPFFVAMQKGAKEAATKYGVDVTVGSGAKEGDDEGQIKLIEAAIAAKQAGILITPMSTGVNAAIKKARDAGLFVIALDTPTDPPDAVDITFATDNFEAGKRIGAWAAAKLAGGKATIALLDLFDDKVVSVDYNRDQGFLTGMGIDVKDAKKIGDEAPTGKYTAGKGGDYEIVGSAASLGNEDDGQKAMENLLAKNGDINVIYTINEPAAAGAYKALTNAGKKPGDFIIVSVDGGRGGVENVKAGIIGATSQQYPLRMADLGIAAIAEIVKSGKKPANSPGLDFFNTGVELITNEPMTGVESKDVQYGLDNAWG